ncbi:MAG: hypothetical protein ACRDGA_06390, partial [Bacteroidota bacterium]
MGGMGHGSASDFSRSDTNGQSRATVTEDKTNSERTVLRLFVRFSSPSFSFADTLHRPQDFSTILMYAVGRFRLTESRFE